ncbi:MAG: hypothetical protein HF310_15530, partial [Ignavibacteria bacterium]|nr:hypothetical protein [Ignavibacteria bacterium]
MKKLLLFLVLLFLAQITIQAATLTITKTGNGTGQVIVNDITYDLPYSGTFDNNVNVTLQAVPTPGASTFAGWFGDLSGSTNPITFKLSGNKSVMASFTLISRTLKITKAGTESGQVKVNSTLFSLPYTGTFYHNTVVTLEAFPASGTNTFTGWGGDLSGTTSPTTITMNGNKNITAEFTPLRSITITKLGTGAGQVKVNSTIYDLPYTGSFVINTVLNLEAVPDAATSSFTGWSGDLSGTTNPTSITLSSNKNIKAGIDLLQRTLTISQSTGTGSGTVKVNGTGVSTFPFVQSYPHGTSVNIEAVPDGAASSLTGWSGDLAGSPASTSVTMNGDKTTSAEFTLLQRTLTIQQTGTGTGYIYVMGVKVTVPYSGKFNAGQTITVQAAPEASSTSFTGWSGAVTSTSSSINITMDNDKALSADFTLIPRTLSISKTGTGSGQVKVNGTLHTLPYEGSFAHNTVVNLEAVPDAATSSFTGWSGASTGTANPLNITMDGDKSLRAEFTLLNRQLMVLENTGTGSGAIKVDDTVRTLPYQHFYSHGKVVKLEAVADPSSSSFTGWNGALSGTTNPAAITMDGDKSVGAEFTLLQRTLAITKLGAGSGQVKVNGSLYSLPYTGSFAHNTVVNLEAAPDASTSSFTAWGGGLSGSTNPTTITMNGSKSVTAEFSLLSRQLMVLENTGGGSGEVKVNDTVRVLPYEHYFSHGTVVKLQAVADPLSSSFTGWSGAITGTTNPVTLTMDGDKSLSAAFTLLQRTLTITKTGTGAGRVKVNGTLYDLPYTGSFAHNTVVNLEAAPDAATSSFAAWGGALSGTGNT